MPPRPLAPRLTSRHKVWLHVDGSFLMGPNYFHFLQAVDRTGTIREAGREVGWSYRTCLNRIRRMESVLGRPVLATSRGGHHHGGARLTRDAKWLVEVFGEFRETMRQASDRAFRRAVEPKRRRKRAE